MIFLMWKSLNKIIWKNQNKQLGTRKVLNDPTRKMSKIKWVYLFVFG